MFAWYHTGDERAYTMNGIFGQGMLVRMKTIGFDTEVWRLREAHCGILGPGADVSVARKPG